MSKINNRNWISNLVSKTMLPVIALLTLTGVLIGGYKYLDNISNDNKIALAALNCPNGSTLRSGVCYSDIPSSYVCADGNLEGPPVAGTNCVKINGWKVIDGGQCPEGGTPYEPYFQQYECRIYNPTVSYTTVDIFPADSRRDFCSRNDPYGYFDPTGLKLEAEIFKYGNTYYCGGNYTNYFYYYPNKVYRANYTITGLTIPVYNTEVVASSYTPESGQITGFTCCQPPISYNNKFSSSLTILDTLSYIFSPLFKISFCGGVSTDF